MLPFTSDAFLDVFGWYDATLGAAPIAAAHVLGLVALALAWRGGRGASRLAGLALAAFWAMGAFFHVAFFAALTRAGFVFGALFALEAVLLAAAATSGRLTFRAARDPLTALGLILCAYAMVGYPLLGRLAGHAYPRAPVFGVAPCPNAIFTFGLLALALRPVPRRLLAIPLLWSAVALVAAVRLGMLEDLVLPLGAVLVTAGLAARGRAAAAATAAPDDALTRARAFLRHRRLALVGLSRDPRDFSRILFRELTLRGYEVVPVNPALAEAEGRRCFPRVQDVSPPVAAALLLTPPARTEEAVRDCAAAGVRIVWMHRGMGAGAATPAALAACAASGIDAVTDLCPMMALPGAGFPHRLHRAARRLRPHAARA